MEIVLKLLREVAHNYFAQQDRYYLYLFSKALALNKEDENLVTGFVDKVLEVGVDLIAIMKQGRG